MMNRNRMFLSLPVARGIERGGSSEPAGTASKRRPAFTLIELLVSLAVISLALAAVGVVFTSTTNAAGAAAAIQEHDAWLRQFTDGLKADLEGIDPTRSALVMIGRTQAASLTEDERLAGRYFRMPVGFPDPAIDPQKEANIVPRTHGYSDPRSDILMFITHRPIRPQVPPINLGSGADAAVRSQYISGQTHSPALIVYGHASFDEANADGDDFADNLRHITRNGDSSNFDDISDIPATDWMLARRATILSEQSFDGTTDDPQRVENGLSILRMWISNGLGETYGADVTHFSWSSFLADLSFDGGDPSDPAGCGFESPYDRNWNNSICDNLRNNDLITELLYSGGNNAVNYHVATVVPDPPLALRSNLSLQALPHCVWFQVEFLMPEDARNHPDYNSPDPPDPASDYSGFKSFHTRFDMPLWTSIDPDNTYVFLPDTPEARGEVSDSPRADDFSDINQELDVFNLDKRIRLFPYGLRITVRLVDPQDRLAEPLERVVVHYFD